MAGVGMYMIGKEVDERKRRERERATIEAPYSDALNMPRWMGQHFTAARDVPSEENLRMRSSSSGSFNEPGAAVLEREVSVKSKREGREI